MARKIKKRKQVQKSVLIAFEDTKSAKYYFNDLLRAKNLKGQVVLVNRDKGQDPKRVIEKLSEHKREYPHEIYLREWIVIDKDNWNKDKYLGTIEKARNQNINVALSNDAYELWILLHFKPLTKSTHRKELNSQLNTIFLEKFGIKYDKASSDTYRLIESYQATAIKNAKNLVNKHLRDYGKIDPMANPITMVYELVEYLNLIYTLGKKEESELLFFPKKCDYEVYKFKRL